MALIGKKSSSPVITDLDSRALEEHYSKCQIKLVLLLMSYEKYRDE